MDLNGPKWTSGSRRFKFENFLLSLYDIFDVVHQVWLESMGQDVIARLSACGQRLQVWSKTLPGNFKMLFKENLRLLEGKKMRFLHILKIGLNKILKELLL